MGTPNSIIRNDDRATIGFKRPLKKADTNYKFDIIPNANYKLYISHFVNDPTYNWDSDVFGDYDSDGKPVFLDMYIYAGPEIPIYIIEENQSCLYEPTACNAVKDLKCSNKMYSNMLFNDNNGQYVEDRLCVKEI